MAYARAGDGVAADQRDCVARDDPVAALQGQFRSAGDRETDAATPGKEVNLPGSVSNCLLAMRGSMQTVRNRAPVIEEMRAAFGRKRRQPSKLGACVSSKGNS